jgi:hypothetical protein
LDIVNTITGRNAAVVAEYEVRDIIKAPAISAWDYTTGEAVSMLVVGLSGRLGGVGVLAVFFGLLMFWFCPSDTLR